MFARIVEMNSIRRPRIVTVAVLGSACLGHALVAVAGEKALDPARQWGQWRGPLATGVAPHADPPRTWDEDRHVRWRRDLPGLGHATPVAWGRHLIVCTAVPHGEVLAAREEHDPGAHDNLPSNRRFRFVVMALDRLDGRVLWERTVRDEHPHEGTHATGSWASASPITDGRRVFAHFGSRGLYCLDLEGRVLWERDFGDMRTRHGHGEGSSPALHGETLVLNWDHEGASFLVALDARNGTTRWRVQRDEMTSWSTPLIVEHAGRVQVVVSATGRVRGYALDSGEVLWACGGLSRNVVASPVAADGMVYAGNSYDWQAMLAIRLDDARGDITGGPAVVWTRDRHTPYVPSPLLSGERLYYLKHNQALLTCLHAPTGRTLFGPQRLPDIDRVFASPVAAAGRVYVTSRNGSTVVLRDGPALEVLAVNTLDESFSASPVLVDRQLYLRGERRLYCLEQPAGDR